MDKDTELTIIDNIYLNFINSILLLAISVKQYKMTINHNWFRNKEITTIQDSRTNFLNFISWKCCGCMCRIINALILGWFTIQWPCCVVYTMLFETIVSQYICYALGVICSYILTAKIDTNLIDKTKNKQTILHCRHSSEI